MYKPEIRDNIQLKKIFFPKFQAQKNIQNIFRFDVHSAQYTVHIVQFLSTNRTLCNF